MGHSLVVTGGSRGIGRAIVERLLGEKDTVVVLEQGVPTFRVSAAVAERIAQLLEHEREGGLSQSEADELDRYEEIDDYLSYLNRVFRNL